MKGGLHVDSLFAEHGIGSDSLACMAWMAVLHPHSGKWGIARSASFQLPMRLVELVRGGMELGIADDFVFKVSRPSPTNNNQTLVEMLIH